MDLQKLFEAKQWTGSLKQWLTKPAARKAHKFAGLTPIENDEEHLRRRASKLET